jgi:hydroxyacyl-ACP dehydratase HTD2-like protein with hotdog domain
LTTLDSTVARIVYTCGLKYRNTKMSFISRRLFTSSARKFSVAAEACSELLARFSNAPISTRTQLIDANQLHLLSITLNRSPTSCTPPENGTPIPPGHHLVYFTPSIIESELGLDGTDRTVNPLAPFTRRMWAGGELTWTRESSSLLRVGQEVRETTKLISAVPKTLKFGQEMLVVGVEKTFENDHGVALVDRRNWVFRPALTPENPAEVPEPPVATDVKPFPEGTHTRDFCQSDTTLFRFSALTFNAHKIHYHPEWCRDVEGHRNAVVHGPLNLINMLNLWRDTAKEGDAEAVPHSIAYRAMSPLYVSEPYRLVLDTGKSATWRAEIWDTLGKLSMKGTIVG